MPFTPFHIGPALLVGLLLFRYLDFPVFLFANLIPDFGELFFLPFVGHDDPLLSHGFFHSFFGATATGLVTTVVIYSVRSWLNKILAIFRLQQESSFVKILYTSLIGVYAHILLDLVKSNIVYDFCILSLALGLILYIYPFWSSKAKNTS